MVVLPIELPTGPEPSLIDPEMIYQLVRQEIGEDGNAVEEYKLPMADASETPQQAPVAVAVQQQTKSPDYEFIDRILGLTKRFALDMDAGRW